MIHSFNILYRRENNNNKQKRRNNLQKMKYTILFNILLIIGAVLAATEFEEDSGEQTTSTTDGAPVNNKESQKVDDDDDSTEVKDNKKPVNFFYGQQSHSVFNSNGNGIVVGSRFDSNGNEEKYVSIGSPKIRIDGDHCKYYYIMSVASQYADSLFYSHMYKSDMPREHIQVCRHI